MTNMLMIHLPATLHAFYFWLGAHWPQARHGCQWQYSGKAGQYAAWTWQQVCR